MLVLRIRHAPGDLCKHLGMISSTDPKGKSFCFYHLPPSSVLEDILQCTHKSTAGIFTKYTHFYSPFSI